jgi:hypothetical protein
VHLVASPQRTEAPRLAEDRPAGRNRSVGVQVAVGFVLVFLVYCSSHNVDNGDGFSALPSAHSLLYDRDLDLGEFRSTWWYEDHYGIVDVGDRRLTYFPWLSAVFATPVVALGDALSTVGLVENSEEAIAQGRVGALHLVPASLTAAAAAAVLGLVTRRLLGLVGRPEPLGRWSLTAWIVILGLGTSLWSVASRSMGQHAPSMLLGGIAALGLLRLLDADPAHLRRRALLLGAVVALAYWERPTNLVLTGVVVTVLLLRRRQLAGPVVLSTVTTHLVVMALNLVLVGRAVPPYFAGDRVGWHADLPQAVAANLVSPARGLLMFSPFLLGAALLLLPSRRALLPRDLSTYAVVGAAGALVHLAVVSAFEESWWGGASFGPRFMSESVVLLGPLALVGLFGPTTRAVVPLLARQTLAGVLVAVSTVLHGSGALLPAVDCWNLARADLSPPGVWDWSEPQVLEGPSLVLDHGWAGANEARCDATTLSGG